MGRRRDGTVEKLGAVYCSTHTIRQGGRRDWTEASLHCQVAEHRSNLVGIWDPIKAFLCTQERYVLIGVLAAGRGQIWK